MSVFHELDNPAWYALTGPQKALGQAESLAGFYDPAIGPFVGLKEKTVEAFGQLNALCGPDRMVAFVTAEPLRLPGNWRLISAEPLEQFICTEVAVSKSNAEPLIELEISDMPEMEALAAATEPGPFGPASNRFGRYIGFRASDDRTLIAMAGERMRLECATEISAVCTAPDHRGRGLGGKLVSILAASALAGGKTPFLHVRPANVGAIGLYRALGFTHRHTMTLTLALLRWIKAIRTSKYRG